MDCYQSRRQFGDALLDEAKNILARLFFTSVIDIQVAPDALDRKEATDLLLPDGSRVAVRVRNDRYRSLYPADVTIRLSRDQSGLSEWHKIQRGSVRFMLYGFRDGERLTAWTVVDLPSLISALRDEKPRVERRDPEGQEPFFAIDLSAFSEDARRCFVIAQNVEG